MTAPCPSCYGSGGSDANPCGVCLGTGTRDLTADEEDRLNPGEVEAPDRRPGWVGRAWRAVEDADPRWRVRR